MSILIIFSTSGYQENMADASERDVHTNAVVLSVLITVVVIFIVAVIAYSAQRPLRRACASLKGSGDEHERSCGV